MQIESVYLRSYHVMIFLLISLIKQSCSQLNIDMSLADMIQTYGKARLEGHIESATNIVKDRQKSDLDLFYETEKD